MIRILRKTSCRLLLCVLSAAAPGLLLPSSAAAQAHVTIDLAKPVNFLNDTAFGFSASMSSNDTFSLPGTSLLRTAGITTPRYPGNFGTADLYHWSTRSPSKYKGSESGYLAPNSDFGHFALMAEKLGNAVIVVNYGTNAAGTGGASPMEAAAWVAYANGKPDDTHPIGTDADGVDWHTVGFWATMRSEAPAATDDGYNFLRLHHPAPFGFKLWQIGGQVYNNGYFATHTGNPDLHGAAPTALKDFGKLKGDARLSPDAYAKNYLLFAAAMKAVDPTISIGTALPTQPSAEKSLGDFTRPVLKAACSAIDFVALEWQTGNTLAPDYKTLDEAGLFDSATNEIGALIRTSLDDDKAYCPKGHTPRIALSLATPITWPTVQHPVFKALWIADAYTFFIECGFANVDWPEAYGDTMLSADLKKLGPAYYGLQMIHVIARNPGDALMEITPAITGKLSVHATVRKDGNVGIMLVNSDVSAPATIKITLKNGGVGATGKRLDYGAKEFAASAGLTSSTFTPGGSEFTVTIPAYTITDLLLPYVK